MSALRVGSLSELWDRLQSELGDWCPQDIDPELATREGRGGVRLSGLSWAGPGGSELRAVRIASPKALIYNFMGFPGPAQRGAILAGELLALGPRNLMVFLDLQSPQPGLLDLGDQAKVAHEGWDWVCTSAPDPWATTYGSGQHLFHRGGEPGVREASGRAFLSLLGEWRGLLPGLPDEEGLGHYAYKSHQIEHSPGVPFLSGVFGAPWTQRFLREFLYA